MSANTPKPTFLSLFAGIQPEPSILDSNVPDGPASDKSRSIPTADPSSAATGQLSLDGEILPPSPRRTFPRPISSAAASPASPSPSLASSLSRTTSGGSGPSSSVSFATYDPVSFSLKTSQGSLDGGFLTFSGTWPRAGSMRTGTVYRRPPLVPLTDEIAFGLWPTPTVGDAKASGSRNLPGSQAHAGISLTDAVRTGNSSTPRRHYLPTPQANDWKSGTGYSHAGNRHTPQLRHLSGGLLNPEWIEWLLGLPIGFSASAPSATPSSPPSSSGSDDA